MAICNLLSLTVRKNQNYEPEAMTINQVYTDTVSSAINSPASAQTDSVSLNGRVMDIMRTLTDKQIEAVFKVGYNNAVNQMVEIITTCKDISDQELIDMFIGKANGTQVNTRLRIIKNTTAKKERINALENANKAKDNANAAYEALKNAQSKMVEMAQNQYNASKETTDLNKQEDYENKAYNAAVEAKNTADDLLKNAAKTARDNITKVENAKNKRDEAVQKAQEAKDLLDGNDSTHPIQLYGDKIVDDTTGKLYPTDDTNPLQTEKALEIAAQEVIDKVTPVITALEEKVSLRQAKNYANDAKNAAESANTKQSQTPPDSTATDDIDKAIEKAKQAKDSAQKVKTDSNAVKEAEGYTSVANGAEALAYAIDAALKIAQAQEIVKGAGSPPDTSKIKQAVRLARQANTAAANARAAIIEVEKFETAGNALADATSLKGTAISKLDTWKKLYDTTTAKIEEAAKEIIDMDPEPEENSQDPPGSALDVSNLPTSVVPNDSDFNTAIPDLVVERKGSTKSKNNITSKITLKATSKDGNSAFPDVYYTIEPADGKKCNIKVEYLANGRVFITGDNMKIIAKGGQQDNLIIIGSNNIIDTNDENDTVRVAFVRDSAASTKFFSNEALKSTNNKILTGAGDDYVESYGYQAVDTGDGYDRILTDFGTNSSGQPVHTSFKNEEESVEIYDSVDKSRSNKYPNYGYKTKNSESTTDGNYTWSLQNGFGDCQTLATLNSIFQHYPMSEYIDITYEGDEKWTVYFKKSEVSQTVKLSDIVTGSVMGDRDMKVIEAAMRIYMKDKYNLTFDNDDTSSHSMGRSDNYRYISKLLFNVETSISGVSQYNLEDKHYRWFINEYNARNITQASFACANGGATNKDLGIIGGHAYSLAGGKAGEYAILINPHDSNDRIKLDWADFKKYFKSALLIGDTWKAFDDEFGVQTPKSTNVSSSLPNATSPQNSPELVSPDGTKVMYLFENNTSEYDEISAITKQMKNIQSVLNNVPKKLKIIS